MSSDLTKNVCTSCRKEKDSTHFYFKTHARLDTTCKDCRRKKRITSYQSKKIENNDTANKINDQSIDVMSVPLENSLSNLNEQDFKNLVDTISILLKIDQRVNPEKYVQSP